MVPRGRLVAVPALADVLLEGIHGLHVPQVFNVDALIAHGGHLVLTMCATNATTVKDPACLARGDARVADIVEFQGEG